MTPDFTLIWPLSCLKDGVHLCPIAAQFHGTRRNCSLWADKTLSHEI